MVAILGAKVGRCMQMELACNKSMVICIIKNSITNQMRCQAIPWFVRLVATTSQTYDIFSKSQGKIG